MYNLSVGLLDPHSTIKMASKSILKTFWPVLKLLQLLGACPIQKDEDSACGFKAFTFRVYLTIVLFDWLVLVFGIYSQTW